jgi:hypothetical protein
MKPKISKSVEAAADEIVSFADLSTAEALKNTYFYGLLRVGLVKLSYCGYYAFRLGNKKMLYKLTKWDGPPKTA